MSHSTTEKYLAAQTFFAGMSTDSIKFLSRSVTERQVERGLSLFRQGDRAKAFYLVRSGLIAVEIPAISGPSLEVQNVGAGQILGWSWLIPPYQWDFQGRSAQSSEVLEFDGETVLARCEADAAFGYDLTKRFAGLMAERMYAARQKIMDAWNPAGFG